MEIDVIISFGVVFLILIGLFVGAFVAYRIIKANQLAESRKSLPSDGADTSDYGAYLAEKYRNEKIQREQ